MKQPTKTWGSAQRQAGAALQSESPQVGRVRDSATHNRGPKPRPLIGNQAALQALSAGRRPRGVLQAKLAINEPGDVFEQEADRVADSVMRMPAAGTFADGIVEGGSSGQVQRACACGGTCGDCQEKGEMLQRAAESSLATAGTAPPIVDEVLSSPGRTLDSHTRAF